MEEKSIISVKEFTFKRKTYETFMHRLSISDNSLSTELAYARTLASTYEITTTAIHSVYNF